MDREIKFRAWDKERNEFLSHGCILISVESGKNPVHNPQYLDIVINPDRYRDRFVLMQYTGLKDKNGKEVYEGDILQYEHEGEKVFTGPVSWENEMSFFKCEIGLNIPIPEDLCMADMSYEVIGNIYENPMLLK